MTEEQEQRRDEVRMEYLLELVAVHGECLAKNLRELADIGERLGFNSESVTSVREWADTIREWADTISELKKLANMKGGAE